MTAPVPPVPDIASAESTAPAAARPPWPAIWRAVFGEGLSIAGFERDTSTSVERWIGVRDIVWTDGTTGASRVTPQHIAIDLRAEFPFAKPLVRPLRDVPDTLHLAVEFGERSLCLWVDNQYGWRPWSSAADVLARVDQWFQFALEERWPADQRAPDRHLIFAQSASPRLMVTGEDWPPPAGTAGQFGVWVRNAETLLAGGPSSRLTEPPAGAPPTRERLHFTGSRSGAAGGRGYWFRVTTPPPAAETLAELFTLIERAQEQEAGAVLRGLRMAESSRLSADAAKLFIALGYEDPDHGEHWVFLVADRVAHARNWSTPQAVAATRVAALAAAPASPEALLRRTGRTATAVAGARVLIFGAGALGGSVALWLAKAGVPNMCLVDDDILRPGNLVRHVGSSISLGEQKTHAIRWEILQRVPDCNVRTRYATWDRAHLMTRVAEADLVIDATAVPAFGLLLNDVCVTAGRPLVHGAVFHGGAVGRVRAVRPGTDACVLCYENGYVASDERYPRIPLDQTPLFYESGCNVPTVDATAVDTDLIANVIARTALRILRGTLGAPNHAIVVNDPLRQQVPPFDAEGMTWTRWAPRTDCACCASPSASAIPAGNDVA